MTSLSNVAKWVGGICHCLSTVTNAALGFSLRCLVCQLTVLWHFAALVHAVIA
jgi:hypothetical protein